MLIYLENDIKNTFTEINKGLTHCTMRMGKIGEQGICRTYTNQNMANKLLHLKKLQGYKVIEQNPKYKMIFLSINDEIEYQLFKKRVVVKSFHNELTHILNFTDFESVIDYMKTRYFYDIIEGNYNIKYSSYPLENLKNLTYFDMKKESLKFADIIEGSITQKSYETQNSLIVKEDINVEEFIINCKSGKSIFHFQSNFRAKNFFVMETQRGDREFNIFIDGDLEADTIFLLYNQNLIVKGEVKINTLIYKDVADSLRIPRNGVKNHINIFKNKAIFKSRYLNSNYMVETSSLQKAMLNGQDVYSSNVTSLEARDKVFRAMPILLKDDWGDTNSFQSLNISIWDRWLYTTGDEHLLNNMSLEEITKNTAKFLKFHTLLLLDRYEVFLANPIINDDWEIYKKNSNEKLTYQSIEDMPMLIVPKLKFIYYFIGDYTSVISFANKKIMDEIDELVKLSKLEYIGS